MRACGRCMAGGSPPFCNSDLLFMFLFSGSRKLQVSFFESENSEPSRLKRKSLDLLESAHVEVHIYTVRRHFVSFQSSASFHPRVEAAVYLWPFVYLCALKQTDFHDSIF